MGGTGNAQHKQRNTKVNAIERYNNKRRRERKKRRRMGRNKEPYLEVSSGSREAGEKMR